MWAGVPFRPSLLVSKEYRFHVPVGSLVWLTAMPYSGQDSANYSSAGYKQAITDVEFAG